MNKTLIICRGVSGSGKSTFASTIKELYKEEVVICSADKFFEDDKGNYNFKPEWLGKAHQCCKEDVEFAMAESIQIIICSNTNTSEKEMKPYIELAKKNDYMVISLIVENRHGNTNQHNVPEETIQKQVQRLKSSIKLV